MALPTDRVIADGAYHSIERAEALNGRGTVAVIPPSSHAVVHGHEAPNCMTRRCDTSRITAAFMRFTKSTATDCGLLVEAQISRIKRCIGSKLLTQKLESQAREGVVIANIINLWNSFGRPVAVKNAQLRPLPGEPYPSEQTRSGAAHGLRQVKRRSRPRRLLSSPNDLGHLCVRGASALSVPRCLSLSGFIACLVHLVGRIESR
jgi:hypothetical protein